jgi:hypothetical protein
LITDQAARAFAAGLLHAPPRICTVRPESDYEMHLPSDDACNAALRDSMARLTAEGTRQAEAVTAETRCGAAPRHRWRIGRYEIDYEHGRWGMSDGCKGAGQCRTPWGAWLALRRWQRTPSQPVG